MNLAPSSEQSIPPFLLGGFRPFFFAASIWAAIVIGLWLLAFRGSITLPSRLDPLAWHRHEIMFGYTAGVIAGFALTAIPNWTGRPPISGKPLAALFALWCSARLALLFSSYLGIIVAVTLDVGFLLTLALIAGHEIMAARNRNIPLVGALLLLAAASVLDHAETLGAELAGLGWRMGLSIVVLLVALIGGRIIPAFTRNWLIRQGRPGSLPAQMGRFDIASLLMLALSLSTWTVWPTATAPAAMLIFTAAFHAARLSRWAGFRTAAEPLVLVLHLSYAWLPVSLAMLGASHFLPDFPTSIAIHALGAGAIGSMTLAVMTRATRGHTGRPLTADGLTVAIYVLAGVGAVLRVSAWWLPLDYLDAVTLAGIVWSLAFVLFAVRYAAMLLGPRPV